MTHPQLQQFIATLADLPALNWQINPQGKQELFCHFADGNKQAYFPTQDIEAYSKQFIQNLKLKNPRILVFFGSGLGHHLIEYAKNSHPTNQVIIVVEALPQLFKKALEVNDLSPLFKVPQVHWSIGSDLTTLKKYFNQFFNQGPWLRFANAVEFIEFPPSLHWNAQYYSQAKQIFNEAIAHHYNKVFSDPFDAYRGTEHVLQNLNLLSSMPALSKAKDLFKDKAGIVIASGPSLSQSLPLLRELQHKAVLIACPSALPLLIQNKIHPHLWLNIERDEQDADFLKNLSEKPDHVFVGPAHIHPKCFTENGGTNAYLLGSSLQSRWLPLEGPILNLGHSSAHAAFKILELLGCSSIYLFGQDLCYHGENASHAGGVWEESQKVMKKLKNEDNKIIEVTGNNGSNVKTNLFWNTFLKTFSEQVIPEYLSKNKNHKVFNVIPKEFGAVIDGCILLEPQDIHKHILNEDFDALSELKKNLNTPNLEFQLKLQTLLKAKFVKLKTALKRLIKDDLNFAMQCRRIQFAFWLNMKNWDEGKEAYLKFLKMTDAFSSRYAENKSYADDLDSYQNFFHPIIQGSLIRSQIQYFSSNEDSEGNFDQISRKTEVLFQMAKDEAFWASAVLNLVDENGF